MTIETDFQEFIEQVSTYDKKNKLFKLKLSSVNVLERNFMGFINQKLLAEGIAKEKITKHYKPLALFFHPDKASKFTPAMIWLDSKLARGAGDGACFKIVSECYDKLIHPEKYKDISMDKVKLTEDLRVWIKKQKSKAKTYSGQSLFDSLLSFLDECEGFYDEVGQIKPKGIRAILQFMPVIFASYGALLFAEELLAIYALFYIVLKGGQYLEKNQETELITIGKTLQGLSMISAITSTTLLVRILELTFWTSRQFLDASLQISSLILKPLFPSNSTALTVYSQDPTNFCKELIAASANFKTGIQFKTPELKAISAPLEAEKASIDQQFFSGLRLGAMKRLKIDAFLFRMRVLDSNPEPIEVKLIEAQKELEVIKQDKSVYNSKTALAVQQAEHVITMLSEQDPQSTETESKAEGNDSSTMETDSTSQDKNSMQLTIYHPKPF